MADAQYKLYRTNVNGRPSISLLPGTNTPSGYQEIGYGGLAGAATELGDYYKNRLTDATAGGNSFNVGLAQKDYDNYGGDNSYNAFSSGQADSNSLAKLFNLDTNLLGQMATGQNVSSGLSQDANGNWGNWNKINADNAANDAAVAAGTMKKVPIGSGFGYIPTGSAADLQMQGKSFDQQLATPSVQNQIQQGALRPVDPASNIPTALGPRPPTGTGNSALDAVYQKRPDLQQLYNPDGTAKNPNDPRTGANIDSLQKWMDVYGNAEEPSLGGSQPTNTNATTPPTTDTSTNPNRPPTTSDSNVLLGNIATASQPSAEETDLQKQIDALDASHKLGISAVGGQPIAQRFITGQSASLDKSYNINKQTLTQQLATLQAKRQAQLDAYQSELGAQKPTEVPIGGTLVNPITGATVAEGQSYAGKQGTAAVLALTKTYPDAGILPTDTPEVAAAKASNSDSFHIKNSGQGVYVDPMTGQVIYYDKKGPGVANNAGFSTTPTPSSGGSGTSFTLSSDGRTVLANGTPVDLATFQQMTGQAGKPEAQTDFSMVRKAGAAQNQTATRATSNTSSLPSIAMQDGQKLLNGTSPEDIPETYGRRLNAIAAAQQINPNYDPNVAKANVGAIKDLTTKAATINQAISAADKNFKVLMETMQYVNKSNVPIANQLSNDIKVKTGDGALNAFNAALQTVRTEYARILARGGEVTDSLRKESSELIPGNINKDQLTQVYNVILKEGQNVSSSYSDQIKALQNGTKGSNPNGHKPGDTVTGGDGKQYQVGPDGNYYLKGKGPTSMAPTSATFASSKSKQVGIINGYDIKSYATDPRHEMQVQKIYQSIPPFTSSSPLQVDMYIQNKARGSLIKGQDVLEAAKTYGVDPNLVLALMVQDSNLGTKGKAVGTKNPGNVGNTDNGGTQRYNTWKDGVFAVAKNLSRRRIAKAA